MEPNKFKELLAKARASAKSAADAKALENADSISASIAQQKPDSIDISQLGIGDTLEPGSEAEDEAVDVLREVISALPTKIETARAEKTNRAGTAREITLNDKQQLFCDAVVAGEDVVLIGAAGTGKTTSMKKTTQKLLESGRLPKLVTETKWLQIGKPGAAILSFTRKAVNNIRHAVVDELKSNTLTIHKLLEFQPVFYEIEDPANPSQFKKTMRFEPARTADNPLPPELVLLVFEESSMIGTILYNLLMEAMPHDHQEVFLGDIQQLPPVFGMAILGFKMNSLKVIELTEVYRQALGSPIISLAWKILEGNPHDFFDRLEEYVDGDTGKKRKRVPALDRLSYQGFDDETGEFIGEVKFQIWQNKLQDDLACITTGLQFNAWEKQGYYNPDQDIILIPYNKAFGTIELNKRIQQHLGLKRGATVHEIIAGFEKHYLAIGDRVLYDKEDAFITHISKNVEYLGKSPVTPSIHLDRWGQLQESLTEAEQLQHQLESEIDDLEAMEKFMATAVDAVEDRVNAASHDITIRFALTDEEIVLSSAGEINNLLGGNAITVHKFQGSEEERVFFVLHQSHAKMVSRELLYTGTTRARKFLHVICEPRTFFSGISSQRIKGNTLAEKALQFMGKGSEEERAAEQKVLELHIHQHVHYHTGDTNVTINQASSQRVDTSRAPGSTKDSGTIIDVVPIPVVETKLLPAPSYYDHYLLIQQQSNENSMEERPIYSSKGTRNLDAVDPMDNQEMDDVPRYGRNSQTGSGNNNNLNNSSSNSLGSSNTDKKVLAETNPKVAAILARLRGEKK